MALFLLFSIPVFYLLFSTFLQYETREVSYYYTAFIKGILWFFPALLFYLIVMSFFSISYKPFNHYFYYFLRDHFIFAVCGVGGYFIFYRFSHPREIKIPFLNLFSFFAAFFTMVSIKDFFTYISEYNAYLLFILPLLRLSMVIILSFLMDKFIDAYGPEQILYGVFLFLVPVCAGFVSICFHANLVVFAFILGFILFAGSTAASYFLKDI